MRQFIITLLAVSALCVTACEDKEEDLVLPKKIEASKYANGQSGGGHNGSEPGDD